MIHFLARRPSAEFAGDYAKKIQDGNGPIAEVLSYEDVLGTGEVPPGLFVFTGLNRFGPKLKKALEELYRTLAGQSKTRPLNDPSRALGRFELLSALASAGLNDFRVFGAWEDLSQLRFPVFVRDRSQDGGLPNLLHSMRDVEAEVGWALVRGRDISELLVVEYLDTRGPDGLYRKYSAYVVGEEVLPVSLELGHEWVLRYPQAEFTREGLEEERRFVLEDPHQAQLQEVRRIAEIGFGRIDYSLHEGRVQTWEINTLPTMRLPMGASPLPEDLAVLRRAKDEHFKGRFRAAWRRLDSKAESSAPLRLQLPQPIITAALEELSLEVPAPFPKLRKYEPIKAFLRPLKPLVMPLATRTVIPLFAKRKMRRAVRTSPLGSPR